MFGGLHKVFRHPAYVILAIGLAALVFIFAILLPNFPLVSQILSNQSAEFSDKVSFIFSLSKSIHTNFTVISATYTVLIAIFFGMNIALFIYFIRRQEKVVRSVNPVVGISGLISGIFGVGCAACGTFILTWVLGLFGAAGLISFLPLGGEEFGILGVIILTYSIVVTSKKINEAPVCEI